MTARAGRIGGVALMISLAACPATGDAQSAAPADDARPAAAAPCPSDRASSDGGIGGEHHPFAIPATALRRAIPVFAEQSGIQTVFDSALVADRPGPPVTGCRTVADALAIMLKDTGLVWRVIGTRTVTLVRTSPPIEDHVLDTIRVEGRAVGPGKSAIERWEETVVTRIARRTLYPRSAQKAGEQDVVYVRIRVDRQGNIVAATIVKSRGLKLLDAAALEAIRRSGPLPSLPDEVADDQYAATVPIHFFLDRRR